MHEHIDNPCYDYNYDLESSTEDIVNSIEDLQDSFSSENTSHVNNHNDNYALLILNSVKGYHYGYNNKIHKTCELSSKDYFIGYIIGFTALAILTSIIASYGQ